MGYSVARPHAANCPTIAQSAAPRALEYAAVMSGDLGEWFKPAVLKTADG